MLQNLLPYHSFCVASLICPCAFPCPPLFLQRAPQPISPRNPISPEPAPLEILPFDPSLGNAGPYPGP